MDNREKATVVWLAVIAVYVIYKSINTADLRKTLIACLKSFSNWKLLLVFSIYLAWLFGEVYLASKVGIWQPSLLSETFFWVIFSSFGYLDRFTKVGQEQDFFKKSVKRILGIQIAIEVFFGLQPFALYVEIPLQFILFILIIIPIFTPKIENGKALEKLSQFLILIIAISMISHTIKYFVSNWKVINKSELFMQFGLPIWLSLGTLPLVFILGVISLYEKTFMRISFDPDSTFKSRIRTRIFMFRIFHFRADKLALLGGLLDEFGNIKKYSDAKNLVNSKLGINRELSTDHDHYTNLELVDVPNYEVVQRKQNVGITMLDELLIYTKQFDLENDNFKTKIKSIISSIAKNEKTPNFIATIYTDREVLIWDHDLNADPKIMNDMLERRDNALVATYTGGFNALTMIPDGDDGAYGIYWFAGTFTDNPVVGKYVGEEIWKP